MSQSPAQDRWAADSSAEPIGLAKPVDASSIPSYADFDEPAEPSIGELTRNVTMHLSTLMRGEIELAKAELSSSVRNAGAGSGMFIAAAVVIVFSLTFGFIALAEGLIALGVWRWLGYFLVFLFLVLLAALLGFLGLRTVKRVKAPQRTIATTKDTVAALKRSKSA